MPLGTYSSIDHFKIRLFPCHYLVLLSHNFQHLSPDSIYTWSQLQHKFHEHLFSGDNELRLSHLTLVRQKYDESVAEYIRRFRDTKNQCYNLIISKKDLAEFAFNGLRSLNF